MPKPSKWDVLRKRVIWILLLLLVPSFILFFHASRQAPEGPEGTAGVMFGKRIPWETFQEHRLWIRRQLESQLGSDIPPEILDPVLNQVVWDRLILLEEARRNRLRVDDLELAALIQGIAGFQDQGRFFPERYHRYLRAIGMSPQEFEKLLRDDLRIKKLTDSVKASAAVSDEDVRAAYVKAHERLTASVILLETASWTSAASAVLAEADVRASYDAHPEEALVPEQLVMDYAGLTRDELASRAPVTEEDLAAFHQRHPDRFTTETGEVRPLEEVKEAARQQVTDERVREQLTALALDLTEDLDAKRPFEDIVAARALTVRSAGPFPAGNPWIPGGPEPAIMQAVANLNIGEVSRLIETDSGVYLARVTQRIPARIPPFEEVAEQLRTRLSRRLAVAAARASAQSLRAALTTRQAAGVRFEEATLTAGISLIHPAPFTRTQPLDPIGAAPALNEAAFATPLGDLSEVIEIPTGFAIVRPEERVPPDESKWSEEQGALRQELLTQQENTRIQAWLDDLRARAKLQTFTERPPAFGVPR